MPIRLDPLLSRGPFALSRHERERYRLIFLKLPAKLRGKLCSHDISQKQKKTAVPSIGPHLQYRVADPRALILIFFGGSARGLDACPAALAAGGRPACSALQDHTLRTELRAYWVASSLQSRAAISTYASGEGRGIDS